MQNKKIVFNQNVNVEFDPYDKEYENTIDSSEWDILGFIDAKPSDPQDEEVSFVDPASKERGFLRREFYSARIFL